MNSSLEKTTALEQFLGVPIAIQLTTPMASHASCAEVELEGEVKCGTASPVQVPMVGSPPGSDGKPQMAPIPVQLLKGEIVEIGSLGIRFSYVAVDGKTPMQTFIPFTKIDVIHFAVEHITQEPKSDIILPN